MWGNRPMAALINPWWVHSSRDMWVCAAPRALTQTLWIWQHTFWQEAALHTYERHMKTYIQMYLFYLHQFTLIKLKGQFNQKKKKKSVIILLTQKLYPATTWNFNFRLNYSFKFYNCREYKQHLVLVSHVSILKKINVNNYSRHAWNKNLNYHVLSHVSQPEKWMSIMSVNNLVLVQTFNERESEQKSAGMWQNVRLTQG